MAKFLLTQARFLEKTTVGAWRQSWNLPMRFPILVGALALCALAASPALAQKHYDAGVTDTEIMIGQTMPYSGPLSGYGSDIGGTEQAYFRALNARAVSRAARSTVSLDDGYAPAKALEQARHLVEEDKVLAIMGTIGTAPNLAMRKYLNDRKVPQFFVLSGANVFDQPRTFPWTIILGMTYRSDGRAFADYMLARRPTRRSGFSIRTMISAGDIWPDCGPVWRIPRRSVIVATAGYNPTDPSIDSQIIPCKAAAPIRWSSSRSASLSPRQSANLMISDGIRFISFL